MIFSMEKLPVTRKVKEEKGRRSLSGKAANIRIVN
jgi:hypothetical protein